MSNRKKSKGAPPQFRLGVCGKANTPVFTPQAVTPPLPVPDPNSQNLRNYDQGTYPTHVRGVSPQKPEVIASVDFKPVFNQNASRLTSEGAFIDVQLNARKNRVNDARVLFEKLLEDEDSDQAKKVQILIENLEAELNRAESDIKEIQQITNRIFRLITQLNPKSNSGELSRKIAEIRSEFFGEAGVPGYLQNPVTYTGMLADNHMFPAVDIQNFANTKLLYIAAADISNMIKGPVQSKDAVLSRLRGTFRGHRGGGGSHQDSPLSSNAQVKFPLNSVITTNSRTPFHLAYPMANIYDNPYTKMLNNAGDRDGSNLITPSYTIPNDYPFFRCRENSLGFALSSYLGAITSDFAMSSMFGNDDLMRTFIDQLSGNRSVSSLNDLIFANLPAGPNGNVDPLRVLSDASFTGALIYGVDDKTTVPVFDGSPPPGTDFSRINLANIDSVSDVLISQLLEQAQDNDAEAGQALEDFVRDVPARLRASADTILQAHGLDNPLLDPENILKRVLADFRTLLDALNTPPGPTPSSTSLKQSPLLQLAILGECWATQGSGYPISIGRGTAQYTAGNDEVSPFYINCINFHNLVTLLVIALGRSSNDENGSFFDLIPEKNDAQKNEDRARFSTLATQIAENMRQTLVNCPIHRGSETVNLNDPITSGLVPRGAGNDALAPRRGAVSKDSLAANNIIGEQDLPGRSQRGAAVADYAKILSALQTHKSQGSDEVTVESEWGASQTIQGTRFRVDAGTSAAPGTSNAAVVSGNYGYRAMTDSTFKQGVLNIISAGGGIFGGMVSLLEDIFESTVENRGPVAALETGTMLSSGADPSVHVAMIVMAYAHIAANLGKCYFSSVQPVGYAGTRKWKLVYPQGTGAVVPRVSDLTAVRKFHTDLARYLDADGDVSAIGDGNSPLRNMIVDFQSHVRYPRKAIADFCHYFKALADQIESSGNTLLEGLQRDSQTEEVNQSLERVRPDLVMSADHPQLTISRDKIESIKSQEGYRKYFDNFLTTQAEENYFYTLMKSSRFRHPFADNKRIIVVGVPYGYTSKVLGIDPVNNPQEFVSGRKIRISVRRKDVLLAGKVVSDPMTFDFDLGLFFDSVSDPLEAQDNRILDLQNFDSETFGQINYHAAVVDRGYPAAGNFPAPIGAFQRLPVLRYVDVINDRISQLRYTDISDTDTRKQRLFLNHVEDFLGRMYARIAYGIDFSEQSFFIDAEVERMKASSSEINQFNEVVNAHLRSLSGTDLNLDDYLAGNRATRELYDRLTKDTREIPLVDEVKAAVEGQPPDTNFLAAEDLVIFSRMIGGNNPLVVPSTTRAKIAKPKLFERVFCLFIDPDDFNIAQPQNIPRNDPEINRFVRFDGNGNAIYKQMTARNGDYQASQFDVYITPARDE